MSFSTTLNIKDPYDLITFLTISLIILFISFLVSKEALKINFNKTGKEFYSSLNQRIIFYFTLFISSIYKFICMLIEIFIVSNLNCVDNHLCSFVRFSPDILFLISYSIIITFWAQLTFDSTGNSSILPRKSFQISVSILVFLFLPIMLFHPKHQPNTPLFIFLGISYLIFFLVLIFTFFFVSKQIPTTTQAGQKILNRIVAITIILSYASLLNSLLYLLVMQILFAAEFPNNRLLLFDGIVALLKEVIPLYSILLFTSKKKKIQTNPTRHQARVAIASIEVPHIIQSNRYGYSRIPETNDI